ncbi:unnamed protein product [Haemonchus placei]|uniref:SAM-dependent MTase TRM10-type domain-containing protein n=1 Tax=Haemonchus placei TaxID=6290 RepID=A0A0N4WUN7_HAEPC|nr:unnamed protein product [Haemonchus placei]
MSDFTQRIGKVEESILKASETAEEVEQSTADIPYEELLKALMPSEKVYTTISSEHHEKLKEIIKELEVFAYMGNIVPKSLTDDHWYRILNTTDSVTDRVSFWEYVAVKQRREEKDKMRKNVKYEEFLAKYEEEKAKFERGEMGYGPDLYQLVHNPMRNKKKIHLTQGARVLSALRCGEVPKVILDLQYMFNEKPRVQSELGNQLQCVGFYGGRYTHQTVLPDFTSKGVKEVFPGENVVYISKHARDTIDGPLNAGAIALCVSMDTAREALGAARRGRMRAVRLPIKKYIKWQKGPMYLPFPNILRIFREVHLNGGDWETALLNNISK